MIASLLALIGRTKPAHHAGWGVHSGCRSHVSMATACGSLRLSVMVLALLGALSVSTAQAYTLSGPRYRSEPQAQYQSEEERQAAEIAARKRAAEEARRAAELKALKERTPDPQIELSELNALTAAGEVPLLLYGGNDNRLLGCLNCHYSLRLSVWNNKGPYGSALSFHSIWNPQYEFGSELSSLCPWNPYASTPPVVVDTNGNFYGFFTTNTNQSTRFSNNFVDTLVRDHDIIGANSSLYYQKLFPEHLDKKTIPLHTLEKMPVPQDRDAMLLAPSKSDYQQSGDSLSHKLSQGGSNSTNTPQASIAPDLKAQPASTAQKHSPASKAATTRNSESTLPSQLDFSNLVSDLESPAKDPAPQQAPATNETFTLGNLTPAKAPAPHAPAPAPTPKAPTPAAPASTASAPENGFDLSDSLKELNSLDSIYINIDGVNSIGPDARSFGGEDISSDIQINFDLDLPEFAPQPQDPSAAQGQPRH